ncbi:response regulator [Zhengella sp. ZM62]|uniref:response regulator n=1 Tax=Zhengella sedimenti TaxID=3390035 RepID=UPI003976298B
MEKLALRDRILTVGHPRSDLLTDAQFRLLRGAVVPLFSGMLVMSGIHGLLAHAYAPAWVALAPLASLLLFTGLRGFVWWQSLGRRMEPDACRRQLMLVVVNAFAGGLALPLAVMIPAIVAGGETEAMQAALCILLTIALCGYCLQALPAAALAAFAGALPGLLLFPAFFPSPANIALAVGCLAFAGLALEALFKTFSVLVEGIEGRARMEAWRQAALRAEKTKGEFIANMSHEIRTPLNGVLGMAELLARTGQDARQATYTNVIIKSGNTLLSTVNDILDFARIEAGQLVLDPQPFCLSEAVEDVALFHAPDAASKGIEIIDRVDPSLPRYFNGDVARIRQILSGLVSNAVKFTDRGHVLIDVSGKVERGTARISIRVEDTGCGIEAGRLPGIFDRFARSDSPARGRHEGPGLGLAIALRLVHRMGGEIGVESQPGEGSSFWVHLPLDVHEVLEAPVHLPPDVQGARVLIVDDNAVNRSILSELMLQWEFEAAAVESGALCLAFVERATVLGAPVDCVILDHRMPGGNGLDVAQRLRSDPATASLPIVFLSSVDDAEMEAGNFDPAITKRLAKPARSAALREAIVSVITRGRENARPRGMEGAATARPRQQAGGAIPPVAQTRETIDVLVVQDNEFQQAACRQALETLNLDFRIVSTGEQAIAIVRECHPRMTLVDTVLPDIDWRDVADAIRREGLLPDGTPPLVFALVTRDGPGALHGGLPAQLDGRVEKPLSPAKLSSLTGNWLGRGKDPARKIG